MASLVEPDLAAEGAAALARGDWGRARDAFAGVLRDEDSAEAWEGLGWAGWWLDDEALTLSARERAYRAFRARGDTCGAGRAAAWLAADYSEFRGEDAVARGWLGRARRLLDTAPACPEHGWIDLIEASSAFSAERDPAERIVLARRAAAIGRAEGVADLEALGLAVEGSALVIAGEVAEGMERLDEAAAVAAGEELELPVTHGWALCCVVSACDGVGDLPRAAQWSHAMRGFAERWGARQLRAVCRSAYGRVLAARGDWPAAEAELQRAVADMTASRPGMAAGSMVRLAELRARQGRTDEARELFGRAGTHPLAVTGLGALALQAGDADAAADAAERVLRRLGGVLDRVPALALAVRADIRRGRLEHAAAACVELQDCADRLGTPYLLGQAHLVAGELAAAQGDAGAARCACEDAIDRFTEIGAPYDAALARVELARALTALGRPEHAAEELAAARDTFAHLGIAAAAPCAGGENELTARELEVLRLVAAGLGDAEIAGRLVVSQHTVHRHVANVRTKLRLPSRAAAVAYAARAGLL